MISYFGLSIMLLHNPMATTPEEIQKSLKILERKKSKMFLFVKHVVTLPTLPFILIGSHWTTENFETFVLNADC